MVETCKTKDKSLAAFFHNVCLKSASFDIENIIEHIAGRNNVNSDCLSWLNSDGYINQTTLANLKHNYVWDRTDIQKFDLNLHI